ncbi:MAG: VWA domain-containing protein, partial [Planctomycetes bacterium]|nr:VWA domain-containing protein [Planctomycetota bacterium]
MRRLPVYLLIDTSGSMKGEPIEAVNAGLQTLVSSLRRDPQALETAHLSIITFDREARLVLALTPVAELQLPPIEAPDSGPTMTGAALELVCQRVDAEVRTQSTDVKRDW